MYTFYDYQLNGGSLDYIQMSPVDRNKIHTILMSSNDSLNQSSSRRTWVNYSTNGGNTWGAVPAVVPGVRSGYPSMTLNPYLGIDGYPAVVANHADPDGDGNLASYIYFEQVEGGLNFTDGYTPGLYGTDVLDQPIWPRITVASNGNTIMMAGRSTASGVGITVYDINAVFSSWFPLDTTGNAGSCSIKGGPNSMVAAVWPTGGNTMVGLKLWYSISRDYGVTWGPKVSIDSTKPDEFIYYGGLGVVFVDTTLYVGYPATNSINGTSYSYAASRIKIYNSKTNTSAVAIDSTNFPLLRKTAPGDDVAQGWHSLGFTYPSLGKNSNGTRLYLACDAFIQDAYETVPGTGTFAYSDVVYTYSDNGGATWADAKNLTRTNDLDERYVSLSSVNPGTGVGTDSNYLYLVFHEKATAGSSVQDARPIRKMTQKFLKVNSSYTPAKDISVVGTQLANYTGIHAVSVPETVKVKINNGGTESNPTSVTLTYKAGSAPANSSDGISQTFTPTWVGKYADLIFTTPYSPLTSGANLTIYVKAFYPGDLVADNDLSSKSIFIAYDKDMLLWSLTQLNVPAPPPPLGAMKLPAPQLKAKVRNYGGLTSNVYSINWKVGGVLQTPVAMSPLPYAQFDSSNLSYNSTEKGTKFTRVWVDMSGDSVRANDTLGTFLRTYPTNAFAIAYDDSDATADTYWGHDTPDSALACAVRFTASEDMKLTNIDAVINNLNSSDSLIVDSMLVYVWGAGTDTTPGSILWSKKFGGTDYLSPNYTGFISFPVDGNLAFTAGTDYWCGIQFTPKINNFFPMGSDDYSPAIPYPPADPKVNRSFFSEDKDKIANQTGAHWMPMRNVLIHQAGGSISGRFVIRAIGSPTVPGGTFAVGTLWNMVSVPVNTTELKTELFPSAASNAFSFEIAGYATQSTLRPGPGYWLKFGSAQTLTLYGPAITNLPITVRAGWNMIGSISSSIPIGNVVATDPATIGSPFYAYNSGYQSVTTLVPGKGYWLKSAGAGTITLSSLLKPNVINREPDLSAFNKLTITDKNGSRQTLYFGENVDGKFPVSWFEMPPTAPEGSFDVRYASERMLEAYPVDASEGLEYAISVRNAQFPITVSYELASRTKTFVISNGKASNVLSSDKGSITLNNLKSENLILKIDALDNVPVEYSLGQNYPNPFNPSTTFEFTMPKTAKVEVAVYDILGSKVATLFDGVKATGYHKVEWNGKNSQGQVVPSGVYFVKMTSEGFSAVKKALMLK
jgi:hypothetical protein